jgi:prolyl oligopeptidase
MKYPDAPRLDVIDILHARKVPDPYRWLEDASSAQTVEWCGRQDAVARPFLDSLPARARFRDRLRELIPGIVTAPWVIGSRAFFQRREPGQDHAVLFVKQDEAERALIDPNELSPDHTITLDAISPSKEGNLIAYQLSQGGDEESLLRVMDVATGEILDGPIDRCRYSSVAWLPGGESFYYVRKLPAGDVPAGEEQLHRRVYLHRVGRDAAEDKLVFGEGSPRTTYFGVTTSLDGRWLIVSASLGTAPRNDLWISDLEAGGGFTPVQQGVDVQTGAFVHADGRMYVFTNMDAPNNRLMVADPRRPLPADWTDLLPETDAVLDGFGVTDDAVVAVRTRDVVGYVTVHDKRTGDERSEIEMPGLGTVSVTTPPEGGDDVWITYTDHPTPPRILHYSVSSNRTSAWASSPGAPDVRGISVRQVFYESKDGTRVPMFVIAREGPDKDGPRPTMLGGYGGFNVANSPAFASSALAWAEAGGVAAIANLRGGSEYGERWHRAGMRENKQNVFDDFIAAAEWLVANGFTSPDRLSIQGGSNGGLLVGAALTQRPDLFAAVVCSAPLLDMVRYEKFGLGETWNDEYGTAADPSELEWLVSYSPYHHVREGVRYPSVLFTVFESDTRVDPMHARKMCAALQWATSSDRPVLLRRETDVGHGARSIARTIDLSADVLAFQAAQLGLDA